MSGTRRACTLCIIALALLSGCGKKEGPKEANVGEPVVQGAPVATGQNSLSLTALDLASVHKADEDAANKKYHGKLLEIVGEVDSLRPEKNQAIITLKGGKDLFPIMCWTQEDEPWKKMARGQQVKLRGKFLENIWGVALHDCTVVDSKGPGVPELTAEELGKAAASRRDAIIQQHGGKQVVLSGKVLVLKATDKGETNMVLDSAKQGVVICMFEGSAKESLVGLKEGERIRLIGEFSEFPDPGEVAIGACQRLKEKK